MFVYLTVNAKLFKKHLPYIITLKDQSNTALIYLNQIAVRKLPSNHFFFFTGGMTAISKGRHCSAHEVKVVIFEVLI